MSLSPIRYISFDCYGTLVNYRVGDVARDRLADRVPPDRMAAFLDDFTGYRFEAPCLLPTCSCRERSSIALISGSRASRAVRY